MSGSDSARASERQLLDWIGLAARAGKLVAGTDSVRQGVRDGEVAGVLLAADASPTQHAKLIPLLDAREIRYHLLLSRERLGAAIGRAPVTAVGLTDEKFARRAAELIAALPAPQD